MTPLTDFLSRLRELDAAATNGKWLYNVSKAELTRARDNEHPIGAAIWGWDYGPAPADGNLIALLCSQPTRRVILALGKVAEAAQETRRNVERTHDHRGWFTSLAAEMHALDALQVALAAAGGTSDD